MVKVVLFIGALFGYINALRVEEQHELPVTVRIIFIFSGWIQVNMSWRYNTMVF